MSSMIAGRLTSPRVERGGLPEHKLQRVYALIESHLAEAMHVRTLAQSVNLSPFHFARMFKKSTGRSPHAFITQRRMDFAKQLLADESLSLLEVATRAGYQTQAHFTDVFRKQTGVTPGRYRRMCLEEGGGFAPGAPASSLPAVVEHKPATVGAGAPASTV